MEIYRILKTFDEISEVLHELDFLINEEIMRLKDKNTRR